MSKMKCFVAAATVVCATIYAAQCHAVTVSYTGSDYDIGGTFFAGGGPANVSPYVVVPWRSNSTPKLYDVDNNNVYGTDGYAMFGTEFQYPQAYPCCGSAVAPTSATHPNLISLPSYISASQFLVTAGNSKVGGWSYALVDPPSVNGARNFNWGLGQSPPSTGQAEYVKIGILEGPDMFGNSPRTAATGAGRWAFTVGANPPQRIRVGVMTDGLDANQWTSSEVLLHQVSGTSIISTATTGTIPIGTSSPYTPGINRFVDIHTFDIVGAQAGDTFAVFSKAFSNGQGGISAITFDAVVPEPTGLALAGLALAGCVLSARLRHSS